MNKQTKKQIDSIWPWMHVYSDNAQEMSKCDKNISHATSCTSLFLLHFDVICALLEYTCTAKWNLFDAE